MLDDDHPFRRKSDAALKALTGKTTGLGRETVEIGAFLDDLRRESAEQTRGLDQVHRMVQDMTASTKAMTASADRVADHAGNAMEDVRQSSDLIAASSQSAQQLAEWVRSVDAEGQSVANMVTNVKASNDRITGIARQINILAINAKIEAARAGEAGRGFSIVADAVKDLSVQTTEAAVQISEMVSALAGWAEALQGDARRNSDGAQTVINSGTKTNEALERIQHRVQDLSRDASDLTAEVGSAARAMDTVAPALGSISGSIAHVAKGVDEASARCHHLVDTSETIMQTVVDLGGDGEDSPMIALAQDIAGQIARRFDDAIATHAISQAALFDTQYRPIPGSNPPQVLTAFTKLTDAVLPAIQEPVLEQDPRIVFCAAVDRNGYLPTHNAQFSRPPSDDPVWNAAHCRNRRIFDDRVGLKAGRNTHPFLLQVYRRDMGGGNFVMMKDLSAPIIVRGRHWGGLRLAYRF